MGALISLYLEGQLASAGGVALAIGVVGLGLIFLLSGAITMVFAYRLENSRLMIVYQELREALEGARLPPEDRILKKVAPQGRSDLSLTKGSAAMVPTARVQRGPSRPRVARAQGPSQLPALFFSILLEIQIEEFIILSGKIQAGPVTGETRNDAAMFLAESGRFKGLTKVLPSHGCVGGEACALRRRQRVNRGREGTNGLLDAFVGRRQLELGIEQFEVMTELLSKRLDMIGCGSSRFRHGDEKDDTRSHSVATTGCSCLFLRRFV